jgi:hypothetical protein
MVEPNGSCWILLFVLFIAETNPSRLKERLKPLEEAISFRLQELEGMATGQSERVALKIASDRVREIKGTRLGFHPAPARELHLLPRTVHN